MLHPGLTSVTFRALPPQAVVALAAQARLGAIEWGGDIHVPHGDVECAKQVRAITEDAGLAVSSYGSYYRAGALNKFSFEQVLESAATLAAPVIRVWAGVKGSRECGAEERRAVLWDAQRIAELAGRCRIKVAFEYHQGTLTDTTDSALQMLQELSACGLQTYWQPPNGMPEEQCEAGLKSILPWLANLHAFHWTPERKPLSEGRAAWERYLAAAGASSRDHFVLLEFVAGDDPANFLRDAATLQEWLKQKP